MTTLRLVAAVCLSALGLVAAEYLKDVCQEVTENNGLIPPLVPDSFVWKAEVTDLNKRTTGWEELYLDSDNVRAKLKYVLNGIEKFFIFDYDVEQVVSYSRVHPGVPITEDVLSQITCTAVDMGDSKLKNLFGFRNGEILLKRPQMFTSNQVMRFGGEYNFQYVNRSDDLLEERGYSANAFEGCVYDKWNDVTINSTYYWTGKDVSTSAGDTKTEEIDSETWPIPVKVRYNGIQYMAHNEGGKQELNVNKSHSVAWFKRNPTFANTDFQVPLRTYCENYRKSKDLPVIPSHFSARIEKTVVERNENGTRTSSIEDYSEIWYDYDLRLIRQDITPTEDFPEIKKLYPEAPVVSGVYDFNTGVVYWIEPNSGRCSPMMITEKDPLVEEGDLGIYMVKSEVVLMIYHEGLEYKGKYFVRDIECDVWGRKEKKMEPSASTIYQEYYFPAEGFHSDADEDEEYSIPIRTTMSMYTKSGKKRSYKSEDMNVFKFKAKQPSVTMYDISACLEHYKHRYLMIYLEGVYDIARQNVRNVLNAAQMALNDFGKLGTPLRVQELQLTTYQEHPVLKFSLMEKTPVTAPVPVGIPGATLDEAVVNIQTALDTGDFTITVVIDSFKEPLAIRGLKLLEFAAEGWHDSASQSGPKQEAEITAPTKTEAPLSEDEDGYSSASLGVLTFFMLLLGVLAGMSIMIFYNRRYGLRNTARNPHYKMEEQ